MKDPIVGSKDPRRLELQLKMPTQEAIERLSSRVRAERPLALATGDWSDGYVGEFNAGRFRIRRVTNIPRLYAVQAYGSTGGGEVGPIGLRVLVVGGESVAGELASDALQNVIGDAMAQPGSHK